MARGIIKHLKRMYAPKHWMLDKLRLHGGLMEAMDPMEAEAVHFPWRIHGAGIYANMTGVYWC